MTHTPGPWTATDDPVESRLKAIKAQYEYEPGEIASVWVAREISPKDATLIASAPDLLTIATRLVAAWDGNDSIGGVVDKARETLAQLK